MADPFAAQNNQLAAMARSQPGVDPNVVAFIAQSIGALVDRPVLQIASDLWRDGHLPGQDEACSMAQAVDASLALMDEFQLGVQRWSAGKKAP